MFRTIFVLFLALAAGVADSAEPRVFSTREFFYITGKYTGAADAQVMSGQMYVEVLRPQRVTRKYPLLFLHGLSQTATNWIGTSDGRMGWADYFLGQGYVVYLIDQPARGRSAWHPSDGPLQILAAPEIERRFTATELGGTWPQAKLHTQWPGQSEKKGQRGDAVFDQFYASQVESLASAEETQSRIQAAGSQLLDKIGEAILITHSQAGPFGWLLADSRPKSVKGIVAIEPGGPPFQNAVVNELPNRAWGVTDIPLTYEPPARAPSELARVREAQADAPNLTTCWKQAEPPRQLPHLKGIPIAIVTTESSQHAVYDHCTAKYLKQAGVENSFLRLEELGIHGNGHMVMLEKNNLEVAAALEKWIVSHVK